MFYKKDEQVGALPAVCECFRLINDVNLGSKDSVVLRHGQFHLYLFKTHFSDCLTQNGLTQIFGGFTAYGISFSDGKQLAPYRIIFILLGALAILVGICVVIWLPDSPVHASMLTKEERIAALERVRDDQGGTENRRLKKDQIIEALFDTRTWLVVLTTMLSMISGIIVSLTFDY